MGVFGLDLLFSCSILDLLNSSKYETGSNYNCFMRKLYEFSFAKLSGVNLG